MDITPIGLWTALSAPACAAYGVAAANRERLEEPVGVVGPLSACAIIVLAAMAVASASTLAVALKHLILATLLAYLATFDLRAKAVPVAPVLVGLALGLVVGVVGRGLEMIGAAVAGAGAFILLDVIYRFVRGRAGLGFGDALVAALIGAWLGFEALAWSVAIGGALALAWTVVQRRTELALPFVPALAAGAAIVVICQGIGA